MKLEEIKNNKYQYYQGFFHIMPIVKEDNWLSEKDKNLDLAITDYKTQYKEIIEYNKQGYNVYESLNSFLWARRKTINLYQFKHILIDLDYKGKEKEDFFVTKKKSKFLEDKYWIIPIEINETYNWYHIIYKLADELMFIKNEVYKELFRLLNLYYEWDNKAPQITWMKKLAWTIDNKSDNKFIIKNIFNNKDKIGEIWINHLKQLWCISENAKINNIYKTNIKWIKLNYIKPWFIDNVQFQKNIENKLFNEWIKIKNKKTSEDLIESIDFNLVVENINKRFSEWNPDYKKEVKLYDNWSIDKTNWLKYYYNKKRWKYEVYDFTWKMRFWNQKFLLNYYFKDFDINKRFNLTNKFFKDFFWIDVSFNYFKAGFYIYKKFLFDLYKWNLYYRNNKWKEEILENTELKYNIIYLYFILEKFYQTSKIDFKYNDNNKEKEFDMNSFSDFSEATFYYNDLCLELWIQNNSHNRKRIKELLKELNNIYIKIKDKNWKENNVFIAKNTEINSSKFYYISKLSSNPYFNKKNTSFIFIDNNLLRLWWGFKKPKKDLFLSLFILYSLTTSTEKNWKVVFSISVNQLLKIAQNLTFKKFARNENLILDKSNFIKYFENNILSFCKSILLISFYVKENSTYKIWKYLKLKNSNNKNKLNNNKEENLLKINKKTSLLKDIKKKNINANIEDIDFFKMFNQ